MQVSVNSPDKDESREETNRAEQNEEKVAHDEHVSEVERALQEASHVRVVDVVEDRVNVNEYSSRPEQKINIERKVNLSSHTLLLPLSSSPRHNLSETYHPLMNAVHHQR